MSYHILLIDDDPYFRSEFREYFLDFDIHGVATAQEALKILRKPHAIDVIILDQQLPGMKGTELLKQVKDIAPDVFTLMLTGNSNKDIAIEALRGHAADFMEKPLTKSKLKKIENLVLSCRGGEKDQSVTGIKGKIERAKNFAQRNYHKNVMLQDVADEVALSPKYLSRVFKQQAGCSFTDYKLKIRMEKAKELLAESGKNIEQISVELGYENPESFIKTFRKLNGCTPKQFRMKKIPKRKDDKGKGSKAQEIKKLKKEKMDLETMALRQKQRLESASGKLRQQKRLTALGRISAVIAHELRHPLSVIQTATWNIHKKNKDRSLDKNLESINRMLEEAEHIINNLLNYSRIKKPELKSVNLQSLLQGHLSDLTDNMNQSNVQISVFYDPRTNIKIQADDFQIKEVVTNIVNNAYEAVLKKKKGIIEIRLARIDDSLLLTVRDNGKGINAKELDDIFEPFYTTKHKGTGLGLSICSEIIEHHNGTIDVQSIIYKGTTFTIRFPIFLS